MLQTFEWYRTFSIINMTVIFSKYHLFTIHIFLCLLFTKLCIYWLFITPKGIYCVFGKCHHGPLLLLLSEHVRHMWISLSSLPYVPTRQLCYISAHTMVGSEMLHQFEHGLLSICQVKPLTWTTTCSSRMSWAVRRHGLWTSILPGVATVRSLLQSLRKWLRLVSIPLPWAISVRKCVHHFELLDCKPFFIYHAAPGRKNCWTIL